jgi:hypothetical protein
MTDQSVGIKHFFVDEAGDLTLFDRRGKVIVGEHGVSRTFMVGVCSIEDPDDAAKRLEELRANLLADPYFRGIPSMQPETRKTALAFHAKDDIPEVRREVFRLVSELKPKMIVAIRRKGDLARAACDRLSLTGVRFSADEVYDDLVKKCFVNLLHKADENRIVFARRGKSDREAALRDAITHAKRTFNRRQGTNHDRPTAVVSSVPSRHPGLQIADYLLWAIQRLYEREESRFFDAMAPHYRLIMDLDDRRSNGYGEWYKDGKPLTLEKIKPAPPG